MLRGMAKPALGRGLGALLGGVVSTARNGVPGPLPASASSAAPSLPAGDAVQLAPLTRIHPSPLQPRKEFSPEALRELAESIRDKGIVQPLLVRERDGHFELIAGERRWRAAQLLGLTEAPVIVRQADDRTALELALVENLQRENLNPMEEALGYRQLIDRFKLSQEETAAKVGKSRAAVANSLRLLNLPAELQTWLRDDRLSVGHAKVILGLPASEQQTLAGQRVVKDGLTVRQTEELVSHWLARSREPAGSPGSAAQPLRVRDAQVVSLENKLRQKLATKVGLRYREGRGTIEIRFFSDDELERILQLLGVEAD
jgi:ParB family transcriptional regulator, chromosome partitioning protein